MPVEPPPKNERHHLQSAQEQTGLLPTPKKTHNTRASLQRVSGVRTPKVGIRHKPAVVLKDQLEVRESDGDETRDE